MKQDIANPSIIMAGFSKFDERFDKFKIEAHKKGIVFRELKIFDVQIPIDKRYNKAVNFLKDSICPILRNYIENIPFKDLIFKALRKKAKLQYFDYEKFNTHFNGGGNKFPFGYLGLTPLFIDTKYIDNKNDWFETKEEKENYKKLFSLESKGYKPLKTPTAKKEYFRKC